MGSSQGDFEQRLRRRYGRALANSYLFLDSVKVSMYGSQSSVLRSMDDLILHGSDADLQAFRNARNNMFTMVSVSGAIFAQIALTALSLPQIPTAHWVASGLWIGALTSGSFSVYTALKAQTQLSTWTRPEQLRNGMTFAKWDKDKQQYCRGAAASVAIEMGAPYGQLVLAVWAFILGLAVYTGTVWTSGGNNIPGPHDSRNIFIFFIVILVWVVLITQGMALPFALQEDDEREQNEEGTKKACD